MVETPGRVAKKLALNIKEAKKWLPQKAVSYTHLAVTLAREKVAF